MSEGAITPLEGPAKDVRFESFARPWKELRPAGSGWDDSLAKTRKRSCSLIDFKIETPERLVDLFISQEDCPLAGQLELTGHLAHI